MLTPASAVLKPEDGGLSFQDAMLAPVMNLRLPFPFFNEALEHADSLV
jgi:hypothetical protein